MHALVTGGAGFIGSTLVDRLLADGHSVTVVDDLSTGQASNLDEAKAKAGDRLTVHESDIRQSSTVDQIAAAQPEVVFHLAAQINVRDSAEDPVNDASINLIGTINVLEGARKGGARKVVFASSSAIYGEVPEADLPIVETHSMAPVSPYGVTKKSALDYLFAFKAMHGLDFTALAFANVFGPRQNSKSEAGVISIFAERILTGQPCVVYGNGHQTRDYVFVDDVVAALVAAIDAGSGEVFNIGRGAETSVLEIFDLVAAAAGTGGSPVHEEAKAGDPARVSLDPGKAKSGLGWSAQVAVEPGIKTVVDWARTVFA